MLHEVKLIEYAAGSVSQWLWFPPAEHSCLITLDKLFEHALVSFLKLTYRP